MQDHAARADLGTVADPDIAQDLCTSADRDAAADFGMPIADLLAGSAERDLVQ
jgi:hypothetical protein